MPGRAVPSFLTWTLFRCQSAQEIVRYLLSLIDCGGVRANVLSKYLNEHSAYMRSKGVAFSKKTVRGMKVNHLERVSMGVDGAAD